MAVGVAALRAELAAEARRVSRLRQIVWLGRIRVARIVVMNAKRVREAALALSPEERAELARDLLHSLESSPSEEADASWVAELEKRSRELDDGSVTPVDWEEARGRILARLRRRAS